MINIQKAAKFSSTTVYIRQIAKKYLEFMKNLQNIQIKFFFFFPERHNNGLSFSSTSLNLD